MESCKSPKRRQLTMDASTQSDPGRHRSPDTLFKVVLRKPHDTFSKSEIGLIPQVLTSLWLG